ncbi:MAG: NmrA family NAD(P)-binding protein [Treponema sp.]|jgi:uncharacterized protein YbjT (DUF2867 family)|nr:NmrA family NAD(P)-binding protein [Treponema sp.]
MVLVTSAYGNAGKGIIEVLLKNGFEVRATDTHPKTEDLKSLGVKEVLVGDINKLSFMYRCVKGIDSILFIPPLFTAGGYYVGKYIIDEAIKNGVKQFILHSVNHSGADTLSQHAARKKIEEHITHNNLSDKLCFTLIQPMHYMYNFYVNQVRETGKYSIFYDLDSKLSFVDLGDVAEVVIKVIKNPEKHNGKTYELGGSDFLSPNDMIKLFNKKTHSRAQCERIDVKTYLGMIHTEDVYAIETLKSLSHIYSEYGVRGNSNVLENLLGRKPTTFTQYLEKSLKNKALSNIFSPVNR